MNFAEENTEKERAIIFLHSKNLANWVWNKQVNQFIKFHCIYLDLPNHGDNPIDNEFSIESSVEILKELILSLNKKEVNLIGVGLGGQIAIEFISKYPDLINKIIVSGVETVDVENKVKFEESIIHILDKTKAILEDKKPGFLTLAYLRHFGIEMEYFDIIKETYENADHFNLKKISFESLNYSLNQNPKDKTKEIIVCYGDYDTKWCKSSAYDIKTIYPNAKIMKIEKAVHLWNIRKYELFNQITNDYFTD